MLESLKARWLKEDNSKALSRESVDLLLCSEELVDLIDFLRERDIHNEIEKSAASIFQSERAAEGRDLLIAMKEPYPENSWRFSYRQHWSKTAGFFCPPEHFEEFHKALGGGMSSQEALLGFNLARMKTDPAAAVASTMEALRKSLDSQSRDQCLVEQMGELQKNADFGAIEGLLPWDQPPFPGSPWYKGREALLAKWAEVDAAGAANYIIQHPERLGPEMIKPVTKTVVSVDFESGMEWVQGLPKGEYFDDATSEATLFLLMMEDKGRAKQLAGKVGSEELRQHLMEALSEAETPVGELEEP